MSDKFNLVKKGYDPEEVDPYIETIEEVLKSYKEKDTAIKNALINAQIAADNIVKNAEIEAERIKDRAARFLDEISQAISAQRGMVKGFQDEYSHLVQKYLQQFSEREILSTYAKIDELENYVAKLRRFPGETPGESPAPGLSPGIGPE